MFSKYSGNRQNANTYFEREICQSCRWLNQCCCHYLRTLNQALFVIEFCRVCICHLGERCPLINSTGEAMYIQIWYMHIIYLHRKTCHHHVNVWIDSVFPRRSWPSLVSTKILSQSEVEEKIYMFSGWEWFRSIPMLRQTWPKLNSWHLQRPLNGVMNTTPTAEGSPWFWNRFVRRTFLRGRSSNPQKLMKWCKDRNLQKTFNRGARASPIQIKQELCLCHPCMCIDLT